MDERKECFLVGGGPSLIGFDFNLLKERDVIVVNKSIKDVPWAKYFVTVDYTFLFKFKFTALKLDQVAKVFVVCLHFDFMVEQDGKIVDIRHNLVYDLSLFDVVVKSKAPTGFGYRFSDFRDGYNSGYCALQLAIILGYKKIYLLGFDLQIIENLDKPQTHYHDGYGHPSTKFEENLEKYYGCFVSGLNQLKKETDIQVVSLSPVSRLNGQIEYVDYNEVFEL